VLCIISNCALHHFHVLAPTLTRQVLSQLACSTPWLYTKRLFLCWSRYWWYMRGQGPCQHFVDCPAVSWIKILHLFKKNPSQYRIQSYYCDMISQDLIYKQNLSCITKRVDAGWGLSSRCGVCIDFRPGQVLHLCFLWAGRSALYLFVHSRHHWLGPAGGRPALDQKCWGQRYAFKKLLHSERREKKSVHFPAIIMWAL